VLYLAFELGWNAWKLVSTVGAGQTPRIRSIATRDTDAVMDEIRDAKRRFRLPATDFRKDRNGGHGNLSGQYSRLGEAGQHAKHNASASENLTRQGKNARLPVCSACPTLAGCNSA
jgi:hypothetical protein